MADRPPHPDSQGDADDDAGGTRRASTPGMPRWVKVFLIVAVILVLLFLALQFVGGGEHGPRRHGGVGGTPPADVTGEGGHASPPGIDHRA